MRWMIKNDKSINFCWDNCITIDPIRELLTGPWIMKILSYTLCKKGIHVHDACNTPSLNREEGSQVSKSLEDPSFYLFDIWTPRELVWGPLSFAFPPYKPRQNHYYLIMKIVCIGTPHNRPSETGFAYQITLHLDHQHPKQPNN